MSIEETRIGATPSPPRTQGRDISPGRRHPPPKANGPYPETTAGPTANDIGTSEPGNNGDTVTLPVAYFTALFEAVIANTGREERAREGVGEGESGGGVGDCGAGEARGGRGGITEAEGTGARENGGMRLGNNREKKNKGGGLGDTRAKEKEVEKPEEIQSSFVGFPSGERRGYKRRDPMDLWVDAVLSRWSLG